MTAGQRVSQAMRALTPAPIETSPTVRISLVVFRGVVKEAIWFADLDDDYGDPNLMKAISVLFALAAVQGAFVYHLPVTGYDIGMGFLACCAYAGYKGLKLFASWKGIKLEDRRETVKAVIDQTVHQITERRAQADADGWPGKEAS